MNLDEELRTTFAAQSERRTAPPVDLDRILSLGKARRRRRTAVQVGVAVAAVAVVIGGGAIGLGHIERAAPEPAAPSPTAKAAPGLPDSSCTGDFLFEESGPAECLEPGTYSILLGDRPDSYRAELTVAADGWDSLSPLHRVQRSADAGRVMLNVYEPSALAGGRPCDAEQTVSLPADATVAEVARRLARLPQFAVVSEPTEVEAFGRGTVHVQIRTARVRCVAGFDQYNLADFAPSHEWGDSDIDLGRPVLIDLWVLTIDDHNILVEARQEGSPTNAMIEELGQIRESLEFVHR